MIDHEELGAWLRLLKTPAVGRESARRLLAAFGGPEQIFQATPKRWSDVIGSVKAASLSTLPEGHAQRVEATIAWLEGSPSRHVLVLGNPAYPAALLESPDPPLLLHAMGRLELLARPAIAIVGSRSASPQGLGHAERFGRQLGEAGLAVVSGLALGIDAAAHRGAIDTLGGTVAVVGTGLDHSYPRRNDALCARIAETGLVLSEYMLGTSPLAANFPQRNRIIAGLARGTLVVEAALRSGSLVTARLANEAGRDVFAIPGSILSPHARGCHALIKQGAQLVEGLEDILEALEMPERFSVMTAPSPENSVAEHGVLAAMGHDPVSLDALVGLTGGTAGDLSMQLLTLELEGRVARLPGALFQRLGFPAAESAGV